MAWQLVTIKVLGRLKASKEGVKTYPAAMGFAFAAGTTDGPGAFDFKQGVDKLVRNLLKQPNQEQIDCQHPKPIMLDTGEMKELYNWAVEFTIMAGRRLRDPVETMLSTGNKGNGIHIVIAGLTNKYSQYINTFEEYEVQ
ncbi:hypothetical protein FNV43_RR17799 [Rhamnella rubrinervis]|uniref:Neutral/alkaline non-lysosomal ceramidase N-terminal domain-containing protein n=1 Tax=Rhamnella rubrinervis TaxID=2594499 RepID=A0A8K0DZI0_9ROSA|nr:hypothetical protein FNV43_RR17799 [Rhamnella rubrinervis]